MIGYQMFTQTAVTTVINFVNISWPFAGSWLMSRADMIIFISAFAWVFVLSSAIPTVILGKERGILVQFLICLALTFMAFIARDILEAHIGLSLDHVLSWVVWLKNPILALLYLSLPYVIMILIDVRARKMRKKKELEMMAKVCMPYNLPLDRNA